MDDGRLQDARGRFQRAIETRDQTMADGVLHADYALVLMQPDKAVMPRARWLEVLPDYIVHDYTVEDEVADVDDDLAVFLHRDRMRATVLGEDRSGTFIITDVWRQGNDGWHVWRRHSTPLAAGQLPGGFLKRFQRHPTTNRGSGGAVSAASRAIASDPAFADALVGVIPRVYRTSAKAAPTGTLGSGVDTAGRSVVELLRSHLGVSSPTAGLCGPWEGHEC